VADIYLLINSAADSARRRAAALPILLFGGRWNWISRVSERETLSSRWTFCLLDLSRRCSMCARRGYSRELCVSSSLLHCLRHKCLLFLCRGNYWRSKSDSAQKGEGFSVMGTANIMLIGGLLYTNLIWSWHISCTHAAIRKIRLVPVVNRWIMVKLPGVCWKEDPLYFYSTASSWNI
jgi:hypothetical protein